MLILRQGHIPGQKWQLIPAFEVIADADRRPAGQAASHQPGHVVIHDKSLLLAKIFTKKEPAVVTDNGRMMYV